jgi:hypothetical protein
MSHQPGIQSTPDNHDLKEGTYLGARYDLLEPGFLRAIAEIMERGAQRYGTDSWKQHTRVKSNLNHTLYHVLGSLAACQEGDDGGCAEHLAHAACRIMFAHYQSSTRERFEP